MRIVIIGASSFGLAIAEELVGTDREVVLIDKSRELLEQAAERIDCGMIEGDGSNPDVLREAFRDEDDVCIAVTNASEINILAALIGRSIGYGRVIPPLTSNALLRVCCELGVDDGIKPHAKVAEDIVDMLTGDDDAMKEPLLQDDLLLTRVTVPDRLAGERIELPGQGHLVALIRDGEEQLPEPGVTMQEGDVLIVVLPRELQEDLTKAFAAD